MTPGDWPVLLVALGLALVVAGTATLTGLACDRATGRWRRRALAAEDMVVRLRAQQRQRRQPAPRPEPYVAPQLVAQSGRERATPTVVMGAVTQGSGPAPAGCAGPGRSDG